MAWSERSSRESRRSRSDGLRGAARQKRLDARELHWILASERALARLYTELRLLLHQPRAAAELMLEEGKSELLLLQGHIRSGLQRSSRGNRDRDCKGMRARERGEQDVGRWGWRFLLEPRAGAGEQRRLRWSRGVCGVIRNVVEKSMGYENSPDERE